MRDAGATKFYAKLLAPNDNSKNQPYLSKDFSALNIIPFGDIEEEKTNKIYTAKAKLNFFWVMPTGVEHAPGAQLILYPDYPEVRFSGFLRGTRDSRTKSIMSCREPGRVLILATCPDGRVLGYVDTQGSPIQQEIAAASLPTTGVLLHLTKYLAPASADPLTLLLTELGRIHRLGAIPGKRLYKPAPGIEKPYAAQNGGGYTLEAELGIMPNGKADPDFMGWEVKSYSVGSLGSIKAKYPTTLLTPEPTIGVYTDDFPKFMLDYGYPDTKGRAGRRNFGGVYRLGNPPNKRTKLALHMSGFDPGRNVITDLSGEISFLDPLGNVAAGWLISDIVAHWARKHAQAAYVPVYPNGKPREYRYGSEVQLGEGTDPIKFLSAFARKSIYLDPAIKVGGEQKKRNQFRVGHSALPSLYDKWSTAKVL